MSPLTLSKSSSAHLCCYILGVIVVWVIVVWMFLWVWRRVEDFGCSTLIAEELPESFASLR